MQREILGFHLLYKCEGNHMNIHAISKKIQIEFHNDTYIQNHLGKTTF